VFTLVAGSQQHGTQLNQIPCHTVLKLQTHYYNGRTAVSCCEVTNIDRVLWYMTNLQTSYIICTRTYETQTTLHIHIHTLHYTRLHIPNTYYTHNTTYIHTHTHYTTYTLHYTHTHTSLHTNKHTHTHTHMLHHALVLSTKYCQIKHTVVGTILYASEVVFTPHLYIMISVHHSEQYVSL